MFYLYDITKNNLINLKIEENNKKDRCIIKDERNTCYSGFILYQSIVTISCEVSFYKSSKTNKYIPRLTFKKLDKDGIEKYIDDKKPIKIELNTSEKAESFWKMIGFIQKFKNLVDIDEFNSLYKVQKVEDTLTDNKVLEYLKENPKLMDEIVKSNITKSDVVSLGYRKKQLKLFKEMLQNNNLNESNWQQFFEKNNWIFGYGLSYIFHNGLDEKKLEQVVSGFDFNSSGKRVDALLKTAGLINSLCFVEIKTHKTELLDKKFYRARCWSISGELSGGVAQIQNTVSLNLKNFYGKTQMKDKTSGNLTGEEFFNFQPKSFLIIGSLSQFKNDHGVNEDKFRSFELFRKNTLNPEIITFDELYERAKFIIDSKDSNHEQKPNNQKLDNPIANLQIR